MKVCIPTKDNSNINTEIYGHFGSAPYFLIYDTTNKNYEFLNNNNSEHEHGKCNPVTPLIEKNIDKVIVSGMGQRALQNLINLGIKVYQNNTYRKTLDLLNNIENLELQELTIDNCCNHSH